MTFDIATGLYVEAEGTLLLDCLNNKIKFL